VLPWRGAAGEATICGGWVSTRSRLGLEGCARTGTEGSGQQEDVVAACHEQVQTGFRPGHVRTRVGHGRGLGRGPLTGGLTVHLRGEAGQFDGSDPVRIEK
jgi:hypothetical protein